MISFGVWPLEDDTDSLACWSLIVVIEPVPSLNRPSTLGDQKASDENRSETAVSASLDLQGSP